MKVLIFALLFLSACASIQSLDGGEIDKTPPKVISTLPDSAQLLVTNPTLVLQFDEYIKTKNTSELLIISPSQQKAPIVSVKGKKVSIQLNDSLKKNTTYSINFNGSIVDFNEGNPMEYFKYVFSTGSYIDSFNYKGKVFDVLTNKPCEKCNVHLYKSFNDSIVLTSKPDYVVQTSTSGNFVFNNLPSDSFLVYAIQDENKNLILNDKEYISLSKTINTTSFLNDSLTVFPYIQPGKNQPKLVLNTNPGILKIAFKRAVSSLFVKLTTNNNVSDYKFNRTRDTLTAFYFPDVDSTEIKLTVDTFNYLFIYKKSNKSHYFSLKANGTKSGINIHTSYTIYSIDYTKIRVIQDSIQLITKQETLGNQELSILTSYDKAKKLKIEVDSGFITDIYTNTNKNDTLTILPQLIKNPSLQLLVEISDTSNYILHITTNTKVIKQFLINKSQKLTIDDLNPGLYEVVLIQDNNRNNLWDTGNPFTKTKPEKRKTSESFEMRLNWDKELIISDL